MSHELAPAPTVVALRERRKEVLATLAEGFADAGLDADELERRVERAMQATSTGELEALVADLGADEPSRALRVHDDATRPDQRSLWAVFGGVERRGRWQVPRRLRLRCVLGGVDLDFREGDFAPGVTELHLVCLMGGVDLLVPPDLTVEVDVSAVLGGVDARPQPTTLAPERPILRVTGVVVMGGVDVSVRQVGESARDARRRRRRERKGKAALPVATVRRLPGPDGE
ncbi:MAG: DUF1707 domain-containing protein [Kofleriaceae bacterium]